MLRVARFGKQFGCGHTPKFLQGAGPAKMLVGELPKPAVLRDKLSQSSGALHRSLRPVTIVPGPYFHARLLCRADDQCSLLLPRPPARTCAINTAPVTQVVESTSRPNFPVEVPRNDVVKINANRKFVHCEIHWLKCRWIGENCPRT